MTRTGDDRGTVAVATDSLGNYAFGAVVNGTGYIITPTLAGYAFAPGSLTTSMAGATVHGLGVIGAQPAHITGRVGKAGDTSRRRDTHRHRRSDYPDHGDHQRSWLLRGFFGAGGGRLDELHRHPNPVWGYLHPRICGGFCVDDGQREWGRPHAELITATMVGPVPSAPAPPLFCTCDIWSSSNSGILRNS